MCHRLNVERSKTNAGADTDQSVERYITCGCSDDTLTMWWQYYCEEIVSLIFLGLDLWSAPHTCENTQDASLIRYNAAPKRDAMVISAQNGY